ncbi:hypothetical protein L2E82_28251 [Cichorium intybus]|uniref:Uncharacterized protein n=1 Tax=Cichorium intybus TaxID=13427 RepID=A0ACB9CVN8_CICIN|nr:hypothetical protein L2E82_28251 [Cichorium intybus]
MKSRRIFSDARTTDDYEGWTRVNYSEYGTKAQNKITGVVIPANMEQRQTKVGSDEGKRGRKKKKKKKGGGRQRG